jgi:hypothetical protein
MFLLVSHRLLREGPSVWSRYGSPLRHRLYGLKHWGFLWWWRSHDGDGRGHHVAHPWDRKVEALSLTRGQIVLVGRLLEDGM